MGIREDAFKPIPDEGYPVASRVRKLEIPLPDDVPPEVRKWLHDYAVKIMSPRRNVLEVSLMVKYELVDDASAF